MNEFLTTYLEPILAFVTGGGLLSVVTFKYTRTQAKADAMKAVQDVYQETIKDLREDKDLIKSENADMRGKVSVLEKEVSQITKDVDSLKRYKCVVVDCKLRKRE